MSAALKNKRNKTSIWC